MRPILYLPPDPTPPRALNLDTQIITVNRYDADFWAEVCEDWNSLEPNEFTLSDFNTLHPGFQNRGYDACNWAITGFTPNSGINFLNYFDRLSFYIRQLREQNEAFRFMLDKLSE